MFKTDGHTRTAKWEDMKRGVVLRMVHQSEGTSAPFSDCLVVDVQETSNGEPWPVVALARPFARFNNSGQCVESCENFFAPKSSIDRGDFLIVLAANGEPYTIA